MSPSLLRISRTVTTSVSARAGGNQENTGEDKRKFG